MASRLTRVDLVQMRRDLLGAGFYNVTAEAYLGFRILATFGLTAFLFLLAIAAPSAVAIVGLGIAVVLGWRLPAISVQRRAERRRDDIDSELPELIDLLVVSVEAGVGLGSAQQLIAGRLHGPMGDELRLMLQEQSMGLSTDQALTNLLERCETPSVRSFVRSLQQGERLGVSIGTILRNLAVEMRTRRRQAAEERAQKAPVKILFPLVFLIFPAIFIVTPGPPTSRSATLSAAAEARTRRGRAPPARTSLCVPPNAVFARAPRTFTGRCSWRSSSPDAGRLQGFNATAAASSQLASSS